MNKSKKLGTISIVLAAALIFATVFNIFYCGTLPLAGEAGTSANVASAKNIQKSDINFDAIREQYLNYETVEKNTASFDGDRWIIVELEGSSLFDEFNKSVRYDDFSQYCNSIDAKKALASIKAKQTRFLNKLEKNRISYTYKYGYSALSLGVAIKVNAAGYNSIAAMSDVKGVYYAEQYAVPTFEAVENNANVFSTGIYNSELDLDGDGEPDGDYQGQGMAVAILDTGLDRTHKAFDPDDFLANLGDGALHYTKDAIKKILDENEMTAEKFGAGVDDVYYNAKVPFAYDYADDDPEVFPGYEEHGTHVAGIVAGRDDTYVVNEETGETFRGVAPLAQLVICKVFTDDLYSDVLGGANDIDILAALDDCAKLGVDVINMSLGTSAGFSDERSQEHSTEVYNRIRSLGISLVCAASNDYSSGFGGGNGTNLSTNPDSGTVGSPSTYFSALSVASINGKLSKYLQGNNDENQVAFITNSSDGDGNRLEFIEELYKQLAQKYGPGSTDLRGGSVFNKEIGKAGDELNLKYVLIGGVGRPNNYSSSIRNQLRSRAQYTKPDGTKVDVDGTVALIKRGDTSFEEKVQEAMSNGADAVIIYNNVSGTINMSLGEIKDPIATCLITMDASAPFVEFAREHNNIGTIQVSNDFEAGPFMSDFSSWGPVSDLTLKPEITAHGGEITSSVPGAYDVLSGTSMASPNMAGAVAILRQYVHAKTGLEANGLNARVNQLLMSTATIARNEEGNPYSPRKQGAGLAGIKEAVLSEGYITVKPYGKAAEVYNDQSDSTKNCVVDGWLDKTKIELFDDPVRTGIYELKFTVHNTTNIPQIYKPTTYVMTETLASDQKTVAEKAFMLTSMCDIAYSGEGVANDNTITVPAGRSVDVIVTITLGPDARAYFDQEVTLQVMGTNGRPVSQTVKPFKNGMYVEGFVSLDNVTNGEDISAEGVTLGLPYLAFYGDWTDAPLFDYDVYEVSESEANSAIDFENKLKTTSLPSQVIGRYHNDDYIIPLGAYLYELDEEEDDIYPERDKIALSKYDEEGSYTVYELYAAYAGLLRNASEVKTVVTNAKTGEVVYEETLQNVGKAYAAGGGNRGAFVRYEINPSEWGWQNNDEFYFRIEGWLDYTKDGKLAQSTAKDEEIQTAWEGTRNTFEFPLTIDFEAPQLVDYNIRFDSYKENGVTKYSTYLDLSVYDNQYAMAVLPCFLKEETEGKVGTYLNLLTEYPIPVYGQKGSTTTVSIDITDYYEKYGLDGELYIQVEDYAMNSEVYNIILDEDSLTFPQDAVTLKTQSGKLELGGSGQNADGREYPIYNLKMSPFELYKFTIDSTSEDTQFLFQNLTWSGTTENVLANAGEVYALGQDIATLQLSGRQTRFIEDYGWVEEDEVYAQINVEVNNNKRGSMPSASVLSFKPVHAGDNHVVNLDGFATVEVNPNEDLVLEPYITPWYFEAAYEVENGKKFSYNWSSSNESVASYDAESGCVKIHKRGTANITCRAADDKYRSLSASVRLVVGEEYYVNNYYLIEWYGGPKVEIPTDVNVMYMDEDCFKNDQTIEEVILPPLLMEIPEYAFQNCKNLKKITIPSQCAFIGPHAFEGCENLETIIFPEYVDSNKDPVPGYYGSIAVGHYAFAGCAKLKEFVTPTGENDANGEPTYFYNSDRMRVMYDGAFMDCVGLQKIDISELRTVGTSVFEGCVNLSEVTTSPSTVYGDRMFAGCMSLENIEFGGNRLPNGIFEGCDSLTSFTFPDGLAQIGERAFASTGLQSLQLPSGEYTIGEDAFADCAKLESVKLKSDTTLKFESVNPFENCPKFTKFEVEGENVYQVDQHGALLTANGEKLISLPTGVTQYVLPESVKEIGDSALSGSSLTSLNLANITSIGKYAFANSKLQSVTWSPSLTTIPEGAFYGCANLTSVMGIDAVLRVGAYAFANCTSLSQIVLPDATSVDEGAFSFMRPWARTATSNVLATVHAPNLETIADYAFAGAAIENADYTSVTHIGESAFAFCSKLRSANFGAVEDMGALAFYRANALKTASFADGTNSIGDYAFSAYHPYYDSIYLNISTTSDLIKAYIRENYVNITTKTTLTTVTLPATVKKIGSFAFAGQEGLAAIDLSGVETVNDSAFRLCSRLSNVTSLNNVTTIGDYAFYGSALRSVELQKAKIIGAYAFAGGTETKFSSPIAPSFNYARTRTVSGGLIATLTLGAAERLGDFAFAGNRLTTVEIPASMDERTYPYTEILYDDKGNVKRTRERTGNCYGVGVFAYNDQLKSITVADGNHAFESINGVLYSHITVTENGANVVKYELLQYPGRNVAAAPMGKFNIPDNVTSIAASAFEGVKAINAVEFPYTLKLIGSSAFFGSSVKDYTFNSVQAPTLLAANDPYANELFKGLFIFIFEMQEGHAPWDIDPEDGEEYIDVDNIFLTATYSNFVDYLFMSGYGNSIFSFADEYLPVINFTVPRNGVGYDGEIYRAYATTITLSQDIKPDDSSYDVRDKIDELVEEFDLDNIKNLSPDEIKEDGALGLAVKAVREAYNKITDADQQTLLESEYQKLLEYEKALREARAANGDKATLKSVSMLNPPTKLRYKEGEQFEPEGITLKVVYSDGSELKISYTQFEELGVVISNPTVKRGTPIKLVYADAFTGESRELEIIVNVSGSVNPPDDPEEPDPSGGDVNAGGKAPLPIWAIALIAIVAVLAVAAATTAVLVTIRKKKGALGKKGSDKKSSQDGEKTAENDKTSGGDEQKAEQTQSEEPRDEEHHDESPQEEEPRKDEPESETSDEGANEENSDEGEDKDTSDASEPQEPDEAPEPDQSERDEDSDQ